MSVIVSFLFFFFKQKTAYEMRISDWSSDVCSSDLAAEHQRRQRIIDHRLVEHGQKLLRDRQGRGIQPRAATAGENDALHALPFEHVPYRQTLTIELTAPHGSDDGVRTICPRRARNLRAAARRARLDRKSTRLNSSH